MGYLEELFSVRGKVALFTGGAGILASAIAEGLARSGMKLAVTDVVPTDTVVSQLRDLGAEARGYHTDALSREELGTTARRVMEDFGRVDVLMNAAGGNVKEATVSPDVSFFDLPLEPMEKVVRLNLFAGAVLPSQVFAPLISRNPEGGSIINFSSMTAFRPLTRVVGYAAAKAAVSNFTRWLAVYLAREGSEKVRVNALAPGFFSTTQNRFLLYEKDGATLTPRGKAIIDHTPAGRFGKPEELIGTVLWLASGASSFVTGTVVPVDGGFDAFSGV